MLGLIEIKVALSEEPTLGGSSFVELITGLNIGLMAFEQLRKMLKWIWSKLDAFISKKELDVTDVLASKVLSPDQKKLLSKFLKHIQTDTRKKIGRFQGRIWWGSSIFAGISGLAGMACLYIDRYCWGTILLALPWPVYYCFSIWCYWSIRRDVERTFREHTVFLTNAFDDRPPENTVRNALASLKDDKVARRKRTKKPNGESAS